MHSPRIQYSMQIRATFSPSIHFPCQSLKQGYAPSQAFRIQYTYNPSQVNSTYGEGSVDVFAYSAIPKSMHPIPKSAFNTQRLMRILVQMQVNTMHPHHTINTLHSIRGFRIQVNSTCGNHSDTLQYIPCYSCREAAG